MVKDFTATFTGRHMPIGNPRPEDIDIADIAHALSNLCRFNGHTSRFYSVAEHSCLVAGILRKRGLSAGIQLWGLMHDAAEAYIGDVPSPIKRQLGMLDDGVQLTFGEFEGRYLEAIAETFGLALPVPDEVFEADHEALAVEAGSLMQPDQWIPKSSTGLRISHPWVPGDAKARFMASFDHLRAECEILASVAPVPASEQGAAVGTTTHAERASDPLVQRFCPVCGLAVPGADPRRVYHVPCKKFVNYVDAAMRAAGEMPARCGTLLYRARLWRLGNALRVAQPRDARGRFARGGNFSPQPLDSR